MEVDAGKLAPIGSQDTKKIPEHNTYWEFFWMLNAKNVKVPVPVIYVQDAIKRGYMHTDKKIYTENKEDNIRFGKEAEVSATPEERMAEAVTNLAQSQQATVELLAHVTGKEAPKKRGPKPKNPVAIEEQQSAE